MKWRGLSASYGGRESMEQAVVKKVMNIRFS